MDRDSRKWKLKAPKNLAEFIRQNCADQGYIIFSEKISTAVCTRCNGEFNYEDLGMWFTHSKDASLGVACPLCGKKGIPKNARYGRKNLQDSGRVIWFRRHGAVTYMQMDDFIIDYRTPHPAIWTAPSQQIRLCKGSQIRMDWKDGWWDGGRWEQVVKIGVKHPVTGAFGQFRQHTHIMWDSLQKVGTDLQYADLREERFTSGYFDEYEEAGRLLTYMSEFLKYPAIELLEKAGFETMVLNRSAGIKSRNMNIRGKDLRSILKMNSAEIRYLRTIDPRVSILDDIKDIRRLWPQARIEDIKDLSKIFPMLMPQNKLDRIDENARWDKLLKMMLDNNRAKNRTMDLNDYADYLEWIDDLGLRKDKRTLYPRDFQAAHDDLMHRRDIATDGPMVENFRRMERAITGMEEPFISNGILIRPASYPGELRKESQALNHCVRTYVDKVAEGRTSILFIRRVEDPETPWFTLELNRDGRIVQCRGKNNCSYPKEVEEFIDQWVVWRKKLLKAA